MRIINKLLFSAFFLSGIFLTAQNLFPPNGDVVVDEGNDLLVRGSIRNDNTDQFGYNFPVVIDDRLVVNRSLRVEEGLNVSGGGVFFDNARFYADPSADGFRKSVFIQDAQVKFWNHYSEQNNWYSGFQFVFGRIIAHAAIGGIGFGENVERLYMTHGLNPENSTLGINVLPNGNTGIGTLAPTTRLEINSDALHSSGLKLTNLTANSPSTAGAKAIGVTSDGTVVTIDGDGGSGSSDRAWLTSGNSGTIASNSTYPNAVNNNFIGTTDNQHLVFATNDRERLRITTTGRFVFHNNDISPNNVNNLYLGGGIDFNTVVEDGPVNVANTAVGLGSFTSNQSGNQNLAVGSNALRLNTTGNNNIALGFNAGTDITKGSNNIIIGSEVIAPISPTASNQLNIGNWIYGNNGQIAIGQYDDLAAAFELNNAEGYQLLVKNGIRTEKIRVDVSDLNDWADYVFEDNYQLISLSELEAFVKENKHLPNIPTSEEVLKEGIDLGQMNAKLLEKIEELTLYSIDLYKENQELNQQSVQQQNLLVDLLKRVEQLENRQ